MSEMTCVFFAIACTVAGVLALFANVSEPPLWFVCGAIWFHLAGVEVKRR